MQGLNSFSRLGGKKSTVQEPNWDWTSTPPCESALPKHGCGLLGARGIQVTEWIWINNLTIFPLLSTCISSAVLVICWYSQVPLSSSLRNCWYLGREPFLSCLFFLSSVLDTWRLFHALSLLDHPVPYIKIHYACCERWDCTNKLQCHASTNRSLTKS